MVNFQDKFMSVLKLWAVIFASVLAFAFEAPSQANIPLYTDRLVNGFQSWSWGTLNYANASPVHSGTSSVSLSGTAWNVALSLNHPGFDSSPYATLSFWANGGSGGGQILHAFAHGAAVALIGLGVGAFGGRQRPAGLRHRLDGDDAVRDLHANGGGRRAVATVRNLKHRPVGAVRRRFLVHEGHVRLSARDCDAAEEGARAIESE